MSADDAGASCDTPQYIIHNTARAPVQRVDPEEASYGEAAMTRRAVLSAIAILLLLAGAASAQDQYQDYIRIGVDSIPAGSSDFEIPFYWQRGCNLNLNGFYSSFEFTTTGDASYTYLGAETNPYYLYFEFGFLYDDYGMDDVSPDTLLVTGAGLATYLTFDETWMFTLHLDIGEGVGTICIDSLLPWQWSGTGCDGPYLLDKYGSNDNHPICLTVYQCSDPNCSGEYDIDDVVYLIAYIFSDGPAPHGDPDCSGGIDIDDVVYLIEYIFNSGPAPGDC